MTNPVFPMDDQQWADLIEDVAEYIDDVTLKRGFQYYKQNRVLVLKTPIPRHIKAVVRGNQIYNLDINLEYFTMSTCTCPMFTNCKHMVAALLHYAALQNRSIHMLTNANSAASIAAAFLPLANPAIRQEEEALMRKEAEKIAELDVTQWHAWFERCAGPYAGKVKNMQYNEDVTSAIYRQKPALPLTVEPFFKLHVHLFLLVKLTKRSHNDTSFYSSYVGYYTHQAIAQAYQTIDACIAKEIASLTEGPETTKLVAQTLAYLREEMLTAHQVDEYFLDAYLGFWHFIRPVFGKETLIREELRQLDAAADRHGVSVPKAALRLARLRMHFYAGDDEAAWAMLQDVSTAERLPTQHLMGLVADIVQEENWARLVTWLIRISTLMGYRGDQQLYAYSGFWELAVRHRPEDEPQMWATLEEMLPYSRPIYEEKLLAAGKFRQWMDYQLSTGTDPLDYRATDLQIVEKNAPEMLLPFYHQAVERYVLTKQRDGYKMAVKLLKRLAKLYKKTKREPRWEQFMETFTGRYNRLRALQEEMRKGKLIT